MTPDDVRARADRAKALLDDPVLSEAFGNMEKFYVERMLQDDLTDDERKTSALKVNALRAIRIELGRHVEASRSVDRPNLNLP
jgi:hypothetical protein